jgi:hypothetical protein
MRRPYALRPVVELFSDDRWNRVKRLICVAKNPKVLMSALGQKPTFRPFIAMSALPPKADIVRHGGNVRCAPKADSCSAAKLLIRSLYLR